MTKTLLAAMISIAALTTACSKQDETPPPPAPKTSEAPPAVTPTPMPPPNAPAGGETAKDSASTNPTGELSKQQESTGMPMAGHGNNHSSPALEQSQREREREPRS